MSYHGVLQFELTQNTYKVGSITAVWQLFLHIILRASLNCSFLSAETTDALCGYESQTHAGVIRNASVGHGVLGSDCTGGLLA
jgi:hypothetical protein